MKRNINIIVGGHSTEFDASILSYENVVRNCKTPNSPINVKGVYFIKGNYVNIYTNKIPVNFEEYTKPTKRVHISNLPKILQSSKYYLLSLLHGNEGEDGCIQGLAEIYNLEGSFGEVLPASLSMNKWEMAEVVSSMLDNKVKKIPYLVIQAVWKRSDIKTFLDKTGGNYFIIKPNRLGASLFTKKVKKEDVLDELEKMKLMFKYDNELLIQKYIVGREFTVGVVQHRKKVVVLPIAEVFTKNNFLGHDEKHKKGLVRVEINKLEKEIKTTLEKYSIEIFSRLKFTNFCRFDYIYTDQELYFLEANSIPGLMTSSIFPRLLNEAGIDIPTMVSYFVDNANLQKRLVKSYRYKIEE